MKNLFFTSVLGVVSMVATAQSKSTGTVSLLTGMTAKLDLNSATSTAALTFSGPSDRWFALQFGSFANGEGMASGMDVVYYNGTTLVDAYMMGIGSPPTEDTNDWTVTSNTVSGGTRTVVATRAFAGGTDDYTFNYAAADVDFAYARAFSATYDVFFHSHFRGYKLNRPFSNVLASEGFSLSALTVSPNPANDVITITNRAELAGVSIINMLGQEVMQQSVIGTTVQLNIAQLASGTYIVKVSAANGATASVKIEKY